MPERRVDGVAKMDAANWPTTGPTRTATAPLRILSGQVGNLPTAETMSAIVQGSKGDAFRITLNGETLTVKGLPPSLIGKQADFVAEYGKSGGKTNIQLFWTGIGRTPQPAGKQMDYRSPLPAELKSGSNTTAQLQTAQLAQTATIENRSITNMRPGDTTLAVVEKILANGRVQLSLQGNRIVAPAPPSVAAGDGLIMKMIGKPASFQLLSVQHDIMGKAHALLRQQAASNTPLTENLTAIRNLLTSIPAESLRSIPVLSQLDSWLNSVTVNHDTPLDGKRLAGMIQQSGLLLEQKLQAMLQQGSSAASIGYDLKALMLALGSGQAELNKIQHLTQLLAELGRSASSRIESAQALNILANIHADAIRIELPMLVNQQMVNVQLSLEHQGSPDSKADDRYDEQAAYKVLIALDMSRLGKLRVDARISDNAVHARIYHTQTEAGDLITLHIERLQSRLLNLGFKEVYLLTSPVQPEQALQQRFDQLEQMKPASPGRLDILI